MKGTIHQPSKLAFFRWSRDEGWETQGQITDSGWIKIAEPVLKLYTEATDGSSIETKVSGLVWHHRDADPAFGSSQAKELQGHLESVLASESVEVKRGQFIVEVKPQVRRPQSPETSES